MEYTFTAYGHKSILGTHRKTLEITKEKEMTLNGDCILGVNANFELSRLKEFSKTENKKVKIIMEIKKFSPEENFFEVINAEINPDYNHETEFVIRKSNMSSDRTFAILADKSSSDLSREFVKYLRDPHQKIDIILQSL